MADATTITVPEDARTVVLHNHVKAGRPWWFWLMLTLLLLSLLAVGVLLATVGSLLSGQSDAGSVVERYESGGRLSADKVAIIEIVGTIMPPFTAGQIQKIEHARDDEAVKAVLLRVDSPGGFVADSHQIYHKLRELSAEKPVYVSFGRIAASGGYYVAMGAGPEGKIFVEPTTWTGSIGVIIPRYEAKDLAAKVGVDVEPLVTGPHKDALSPFKDLDGEERAIWDSILADAFEQFKTVIKDGRPLSEAEIDAVATGRIFTAKQALAENLVDETGFEEDAVAALAEAAGLTDPKVVRYASPPSALDLLLGVRSDPPSPATMLGKALTPAPYYLFGWPTTALATQ